MGSGYNLRDAVYGAAVGDALGVPFEFKQRDTFECTGMVGNGTHYVPTGTFSDDTSMMLATCDSIRARMRIDTRDMRKRFVNWWRSGEYTVDGACFDIGNTTATALDEGKGRAGERDNGNGSLMRIAPLAYFSVDDDEIRAVSAITHAHPISTEACVCFVTILRNLISGNTLEDSIRYGKPAGEKFEFLDTVTSWPRDNIRSGGYVLDTLGAALWCFANTSSYADCVLAAVNLGRDTDTTACVAGALAGAYYGYSAIPAKWIETLRGKDIIDRCLFEGNTVYTCHGSNAWPESFDVITNAVERILDEAEEPEEDYEDDMSEESISIAKEALKELAKLPEGTCTTGNAALAMVCNIDDLDYMGMISIPIYIKQHSPEYGFICESDPKYDGAVMGLPGVYPFYIRHIL